jgi:hypothetical protein
LWGVIEAAVFPQGRHVSLSRKKALAALSRGARLILMHDNESPTGKSYFVVPGGKVDETIANEFMRRPDVCAGSDGLFPGCDQTWRFDDVARAGVRQ